MFSCRIQQNSFYFEFHFHPFWLSSCTFLVRVIKVFVDIVQTLLCILVHFNRSKATMSFNLRGRSCFGEGKQCVTGTTETKKVK